MDRQSNSPKKDFLNCSVPHIAFTTRGYKIHILHLYYTGFHKQGLRECLRETKVQFPVFTGQDS